MKNRSGSFSMGWTAAASGPFFGFHRPLVMLTHRGSHVEALAALLATHPAIRRPGTIRERVRSCRYLLQVRADAGQLPTAREMSPRSLAFVVLGDPCQTLGEWIVRGRDGHASPAAGIPAWLANEFCTRLREIREVLGARRDRPAYLEVSAIEGKRGEMLRSFRNWLRLEDPFNTPAASAPGPSGPEPDAPAAEENASELRRVAEREVPARLLIEAVQLHREVDGWCRRHGAPLTALDPVSPGLPLRLRRNSL